MRVLTKIKQRMHTGHDIIPDFDKVFSRPDERKISVYDIINPIYFYSNLTLHIYRLFYKYGSFETNPLFKLNFTPYVNFKSTFMNVKDGKDFMDFI